MATERSAGGAAAASFRGAEDDPQAVRRGPGLGDAEAAALRARQKARNRAVLIVLLALVALFYALTISRLTQLEHPQSWSRPGALAPAQTPPSR